MPDLLLEVLSEEIPARMQEDGSGALKKQVLRRLEEARLQFDAEHVQSFATPRRLALLVRGLPAMQPDITVERKGPRVDAPQKAIAGFLKSTGLTLEDCEQRETPKGPVWFAVTQAKGRPTCELLADLMPQALAAVSWPKSMRWDESGVRWVRPIRSILCLLDDAVVPFHFGAIESGRTTYGHRFLSSGPLTIGNASSYEATLDSAKVMLSPEARAKMIRDMAVDLAKREGLYFVDDKDLVDENAGLVEWPVVLMGTIDDISMLLPHAVLTSAMGTHQRYFGLRRDRRGRPAPRFVMVANTETTDGDGAVVAGNERVLRARLADARFFWDQDTSQPLEGYLPALKGVVFHADLGNMYEKVKRISDLALTLCSSTYVRGFDRNFPYDAERAGLLCKADLVTEMVGEFPDLQGLMGSLYAERHERSEVCKAICEHYAPQGPDDPCPTAPASVAVALADKLDTLAGFFAIDERPTGSKDPFALRRAALGVIRLIVENKLRLPLGQTLDAALAGYNWLPPGDSALAHALAGSGTMLPPEPGKEATRETLLEFFAERLKVHLRDDGVRHDLVSAVFATGEDDLVLLLERVKALEFFLDLDDGTNLLTAYRRAANILRIEEKKDGSRYEGEPDKDLFDQVEEQTLHNRIAAARNNADAALTKEPPLFANVMMFMAELRAPVDAFFDNVTVNCEDPALRRNRLLMLSQIRSTLDRVADFSKIEG